MNFIVVKLHDVSQPVGDVSAVLDFVEFRHIGRYQTHIDTFQIEQVDNILHRTLAEDRQHPQLVLLVEHARHIGGEY